MRVRLLVANDKANVKKVVLRSNTLIGRSAECNLRIASQEVSRKHCAILVTASQVRVRDLGSSNGTFLNGQRLKPNIDVPLPSGAELEIGNVRFVVQHDAPLPLNEPGSTVEATSPLQAAAGSAEKEAVVAAGSAAASSAEASAVPVAEPAADELSTGEGGEIAAGPPAGAVGEEGRDETAAEAETVNIPLPEVSATAENALAETAAFDFSTAPEAHAEKEERDPEEPATDIHEHSPLAVAETGVNSDAQRADANTAVRETDEQPPPGEEDVAAADSAEEDLAAETDSQQNQQAEPPLHKEGRLKSLFGLLRGRKKPSAEETDAAQEMPDEERARETIPLNTAELRAADVLADVEETVAETPGAAAFDPEETALEEDLPDHGEPAAIAPPEPDDENGEFIAPPGSEKETVAEDEDLLDFLRQLSQE